IQKTVVAYAAAAVLNGILLAVDLDAVVGTPVAGRQLEVAAGERTIAGDLPSADQRVDEAIRVSADGLAFPERQIDQEIPVDPLLGNAGVGPVIQQAVAG